ncbi:MULTISPECIES: hypothetical protein [Streptomyces]|jgi:hypothetical protein|uniref:Uncharacterized protein n=1 Tax=Streptomyces sp. 900129855 TaxID=3155129 RepID=A0ABV2ZE33_9ACTN
MGAGRAHAAEPGIDTGPRPFRTLHHTEVVEWLLELELTRR